VTVSQTEWGSNSQLDLREAGRMRKSVSLGAEKDNQ
jgi:hypothetical protein